MEARQGNLGVAWTIVLAWMQKSPGLTPLAMGPRVRDMEKEEAKCWHLSVHGRWNPQLTT